MCFVWYPCKPSPILLMRHSQLLSLNFVTFTDIPSYSLPTSRLVSWVLRFLLTFYLCSMFIPDNLSYCETFSPSFYRVLNPLNPCDCFKSHQVVAQWVLHTPRGLTSKHSTSATQCICVFCMDLRTNIDHVPFPALN